MSDDHSTFQKRLVASKEAVWHVARWLADRGNIVRVNPTFVAPNYEGRREYSDHGDLEITKRVEVKHLSVNFTCHDDWPYTPNYMVCSVSSYDGVHPKPEVYIHLSHDMTHCGFVKSSSRAHWTVAKRRDSGYKDVVQ